MQKLVVNDTLVVITNSGNVFTDNGDYHFRNSDQAEKFVAWLKTLKPAGVKVRQKGKGSKAAHLLQVK